jgi:hypothetical protein
MHKKSPVVWGFGFCRQWHNIIDNLESAKMPNENDYVDFRSTKKEFVAFAFLKVSVASSGKGF